MTFSSIALQRLFLFLCLVFYLEAKPLPAAPSANSTGVAQINQLESVTKNGSTEGKVVAVVSMLAGLFVAFTGYRLFKVCLPRS